MLVGLEGDFLIWQLVLVSLRLLLVAIISFIPAFPSIADDMAVLIGFIRKGLYFTDVSVFTMCLSTIVAVEFSVFTWNVIKFVYSKIPFLNIR